MKQIQLYSKKLDLVGVGSDEEQISDNLIRLQGLELVQELKDNLKLIK